MLILIASTDINDGIGYEDGRRLYEIPKDTKHFKDVTSGKHVVMGRKTWDALPKKPLPKRKNYVITADESFVVQGRTKILHSINEILELAKGRDVYVIGGGELFAQMIDYADLLMLTHIHRATPDAEVFFPKVEVREWKLLSVEPQKETKAYPFTYTFATYTRRVPKKEQTD